MTTTRINVGITHANLQLLDSLCSHYGMQRPSIIALALHLLSERRGAGIGQPPPDGEEQASTVGVLHQTGPTQPAHPDNWDAVAEPSSPEREQVINGLKDRGLWSDRLADVDTPTLQAALHQYLQTLRVTDKMQDADSPYRFPEQT